MANLLPHKEKKRLKREYRLRLLSFALFLLSSLVFVGILILIPSYVVTQSQEKSALGQIALLEELAQERSQDERLAILRETREKLDIVVGVSPDHSVSDLVMNVVEHAPSTISIRRFSFEAPTLSESYENGRIVVSGVSSNRDALISFTKSLRTVNEFNEVILPVSQLAQENNISFMITIALNPIQE